MLPETILPLRVRDGAARLDFLGPHDHAWLQVLISEFERFEGRRQRELDRRLKEPLPCYAPWAKLKSADLILRRLWKSEAPSKLSPAKARCEVFALAAESTQSRSEILEVAAARLKVAPIALEEALFADLADEQIVRAPPQPIGVPELALRVNLALAQAVLHRAASVELTVNENARAVVGLAKLRGLICTARDGSEAGEALLSISGPFALFRHTLVYGRALGALVPLVAQSSRFSLSATCLLQSRTLTFTLSSGDPLFPGSEVRRFDSRLEERFSRDMKRLAPDWDVLREPEGFTALGTLIFPDFLLRHRLVPSREWWVEIVGFWTPEYVSRKLATLRAARIPNLILCIDEDRCCSESELPPGSPVIRFRRRIDARSVLRVIDRHARGDTQ